MKDVREHPFYNNLSVDMSPVAIQNLVRGIQVSPRGTGLITVKSLTQAVSKLTERFLPLMIVGLLAILGFVLGIKLFYFMKDAVFRPSVPTGVASVSTAEPLTFTNGFSQGWQACQKELSK